MNGDHATDAGGVAEISWDGNTSVSDASWKVTTVLETGWETTGFDDSLWLPATSYGIYGVAPWFTNVTAFSTGSSAQWIWSADPSGDNEVFLRYVIGP